MPEADGARGVEVAPGVFAVSCLVDLREPVSWVGAGATGHEPSTCYLLRAGGEALLVDTGLRAHGPAIRDRLRELLPPGTTLRLTMTRVEPDTLGNIDFLADEFGFAEVSSQTNVVPFDYLGPLSSRYPETRISNGLLPGDRVPFGDRDLLVVEPAVRTLPTLWYYDEAARVLFTSDFFGGSWVADPATWTPGPGIDAAAVRAHLLAKFDWLAIADTSMAVGRLEALRDRFEIDVLAPAHGLWTTGREAVTERIDLTLRVLEALSTVRAATSAG